MFEINNFMHGIDSSHDNITTVESMKRDLKTCCYYLRLLLAILLTVSLIVAALAYFKSAGSQVY